MTLLIVNSSGKIGRRVAQRLDAQAIAFRGASRSTPVPFDWQDEATWPAALEHTSAAFISFVPDLAAPGALAVMESFVAAAQYAGIGKLVLLTGRGEIGAVAAENVVRDSGLAWTIVRAAWFNQNFSEGHLLPSVLEGALYMPAGARKEAFVDAEDLADVATAALLSDRHNGQIYEVTGPELLSFGEVAARIEAAANRTFRYQPVTLEEFHARLIQALGNEWADLLRTIADETLDGRNAWVGDGVQRALGRQPLDFTGFCATVVKQGTWSQAA